MSDRFSLERRASPEPTGAKGDIPYADSTTSVAWIPHATGGVPKVLTQTDDNLPTWAAGGSGSSPLTTKGDIYTHDATVDQRLPIGANEKLLFADSAQTTGQRWDFGLMVAIEIPVGVIDGVNDTFTIAHMPVTDRIVLIMDGQPVVGGVDYGRVGQTIQFGYLANKPFNSLVATYPYRGIIGPGGSVETLPGGTAATWTEQTASALLTFVGIAYSPTLQLFAAVGDAGLGTQANCLMTSPDGVNWTTQSTPGTANWYGIAWCLDRFVVTSGTTSSQGIYSTDGTTWTGFSAGVGVLAFLYAMTYDAGFGNWVGVGSVSGNKVAISADFSSWSNPTSPAAVTWRAICYSPDLSMLCAVGDGTAVMTSTDGGATWTLQTAAASYDWYGVAWSHELGLFAAVSRLGNGSGTDKVMTSPDGVNWTLQTIPSTGSAQHTYRAIIWSQRRRLFVAVSGWQNGETLEIITSPDGVNWTEQTTPTTGGSPYGRWVGLAVADDQNIIVAIGDANLNPTLNVMRSIA